MIRATEAETAEYKKLRAIVVEAAEKAYDSRLKMDERRAARQARMWATELANARRLIAKHDSKTT